MFKIKNDKITIVPAITGRGGIETVISFVMNDMMINSKFKLELFEYNKLKYPEWMNDFDDERSNFNNSDSKMYKILRYLNFLIKYDGSVLIIINPMEILFARIIKKIFKKKYQIVSWIHTSISENDRQKKYIKYADFHLAISSGLKKQLNSLGIHNEKIFLIFNPVKRHKKTVKNIENENKFLYVGRLDDKQKNISGLLTCLSKIYGNWKLDIYGSGPDKDKLENMVNNNYNLANKVDFLGWSHDPWKSIDEATALLLNSNYEGFGMVLTEAISRGIPCISSDACGGPDDIIREGKNGYVYAMGDYDSLSTIIYRFLNDNIIFNHSSVKQTIDYLYNPNFSKRFIKAIFKISKSRR